MRSNWKQSPTVPLLALFIGIGNFTELPLALLKYSESTIGGLGFLSLYLLCILLLIVPILVAESIAGDYWKTSQDTITQSFSELCESIGQHAIRNLSTNLVLAVNAIIIIAITLPLVWSFFYGYNFLVADITDVNISASAQLFNSIKINSSATFLLILLVSALLLYLTVKRSFWVIKQLLIAFIVLFISLIALVFSITTNTGISPVFSFAFDDNFNQHMTSSYFIEALQEAMKLALISVCAGTGIITLMYSRTQRKNSIVKPLFFALVIDIIISLGIAIALFQLLNQSAVIGQLDWNHINGIDLLFVVLPSIFSAMPGGLLIGSVFYLLIILSALTTIAVIIMVISAFDDGLKRFFVISSLVVGLLYLISLMAPSSSASVHGSLIILYPIVQDALLPFIALLIVVSVGWGMVVDRMRFVLPDMSDTQIAFCHFSIRYIAPSILVLFTCLSFYHYAVPWLFS